MNARNAHISYVHCKNKSVDIIFYSIAVRGLEIPQYIYMCFTPNLFSFFQLLLLTLLLSVILLLSLSSLYSIYIYLIYVV